MLQHQQSVFCSMFPSSTFRATCLALVASVVLGWAPHPRAGHRLPSARFAWPNKWQKPEHVVTVHEWKDEDFLDRIEDGTMELDDWRQHRSHVRMAYCVARKYGAAEAPTAIPKCLARINRIHTVKYHVTVRRRANAARGRHLVSSGRAKGDGGEQITRAAAPRRVRLGPGDDDRLRVPPPSRSRSSGPTRSSG